MKVIQNMRNLKYVVAIALSFSILIISSVSVQAAHNGYYWSAGPDSLTYTFIEEEISQDTEDAFIMAVYYWETASNSPVEMDYTSGPADISFYEVYNDIVGFSGKWFHNPSTPGALNWAECVLNTYITAGYSCEKRISVAGHEIGHALGLAHEDWCLMDGSDYWRYDVMNFYTPQYDDIAELNDLYD